MKFAVIIFFLGVCYISVVPGAWTAIKKSLGKYQIVVIKSNEDIGRLPEKEKIEEKEVAAYIAGKDKAIQPLSNASSAPEKVAKKVKHVKKIVKDMEKKQARAKEKPAYVKGKSNEVPKPVKDIPQKLEFEILQDVEELPDKQNELTEEQEDQFLFDMSEILNSLSWENQDSETCSTENNVTELSDVERKVHDCARQLGVNPSLALAVARTESNFNPRAKSSKGAIGVMQVMPKTAGIYGVKQEELWNMNTNIQTGITYLKEQLERYGSEDLALAAYNAGPGAVDRYKGVPPYKETEQYLKKVKKHQQSYRNFDEAGEIQTIHRSYIYVSKK